MEPPPLPVVSLEYRNAEASPIVGVVRFVGTAVGAQGLVGALVIGAQALSFGSFFRSLPYLLIGMLLFASNVALVVGGALLRRRRPVGRGYVVAVESVLIGLYAMQSIVSFWLSGGFFMGGSFAGSMYALRYATTFAASALTPAILWAFLRRRDVAAACNGA